MSAIDLSTEHTVATALRQWIGGSEAIAADDEALWERAYKLLFGHATGKAHEDLSWFRRFWLVASYVALGFVMAEDIDVAPASAMRHKQTFELELRDDGELRLLFTNWTGLASLKVTVFGTDTELALGNEGGKAAGITFERLASTVRCTFIPPLPLDLDVAHIKLFVRSRPLPITQYVFRSTGANNWTASNPRSGAIDGELFAPVLALTTDGTLVDEQQAFRTLQAHEITFNGRNYRSSQDYPYTAYLHMPSEDIALQHLELWLYTDRGVVANPPKLIEIRLLQLASVLYALTDAPSRGLLIGTPLPRDKIGHVLSLYDIPSSSSPAPLIGASIDHELIASHAEWYKRARKASSRSLTRTVSRIVTSDPLLDGASAAFLYLASNIGTERAAVEHEFAELHQLQQQMFIDLLLLPHVIFYGQQTMRLLSQACAEVMPVKKRMRHTSHFTTVPVRGGDDEYAFSSALAPSDEKQPLERIQRFIIDALQRSRITAVRTRDPSATVDKAMFEFAARFKLLKNQLKPSKLTAPAWSKQRFAYALFCRLLNRIDALADGNERFVPASMVDAVVSSLQLLAIQSKRETEQFWFLLDTQLPRPRIASAGRFACAELPERFLAMANYVHLQLRRPPVFSFGLLSELLFPYETDAQPQLHLPPPPWAVNVRIFAEYSTLRLSREALLEYASLWLLALGEHIERRYYADPIMRDVPELEFRMTEMKQLAIDIRLKLMQRIGQIGIRYLNRQYECTLNYVAWTLGYQPHAWVIRYRQEPFIEFLPPVGYNIELPIAAGLLGVRLAEVDALLREPDVGPAWRKQWLQEARQMRQERLESPGHAFLQASSYFDLIRAHLRSTERMQRQWLHEVLAEQVPWTSVPEMRQRLLPHDAFSRREQDIASRLQQRLYRLQWERTNLTPMSDADFERIVVRHEQQPVDVYVPAALLPPPMIGDDIAVDGACISLATFDENAMYATRVKEIETTLAAYGLREGGGGGGGVAAKRERLKIRDDQFLGVFY